LTVQMISPVQGLLEQWLLLPLFADLGLMVLVLRSVRNRAGFALSALLALFALRNVAAIWPDSPGAVLLDAVCASMLPAMVALLLLSYAGGMGLAGPRMWRALLVVLPGVLSAACAIQAGVPAGSPALPIYSLVFFGASIFFLFLMGMARYLSGEEPTLFMVALILIIGSGPVYELVLPYFKIELPLFSYSSAAAGALLVHATLRYKAFSAVPAAEQTRAGGIRPAPGLFIAGTGEGRRARAMFVGAVRSGTPGVIVTRAHHAAVRRQAGLARTPVVWLANSTYEKALPPGRVEVLSHIIRDMGEQCNGCIILIEDVDYLVTNAGLYPTLDMLGEVRRQAERVSMTVLLSSDLLTDDERRDLHDVGVRPLPRDGGAPSHP